MGDYGNYDLDKIYADQEFPLGAKVEDQLGRVFKFIKYNDGDGTVTPTAGYLAIALDSAYPPHEATCDYDSSTIAAIANLIEGFVQAALTDGSYGWVQVWGPNRQSILTDGDVAQGELLMKHATTDGGVDTHDNTAQKVVGVALEADTSTALTAGQAFITIESK